MPSYHQMGHDSRNLLYEANLEGYSGAILSPVNSGEAETRGTIDDPPREGFDFVFDPQLYFPNTVRGELPGWSYFPSDVDTADHTSQVWWDRLLDELAACAIRLSPSGVCSPAIVPKVYGLEYYALCRDIALRLAERLAQAGIQVLQTALVRFDDLSAPDAAPAIASVLTAADINRVYLVLSPDLHPRRELSEVEPLKGAYRLIRMLEESGTSVLVGYSSSDLAIWKAAGARDVATGKFFNLRRFTPARWDLPPEGGGQLPYWFEEAMMAFLRTSDLLRIRDAGHLSPASQANPFAQQILDIVLAGSDAPWLALSWRQYLFWFADFERRAHAGQLDIASTLGYADEVWSDLDHRGVLMEERTNTGAWVRAWRRVLIEAPRPSVSENGA